MYTEKYTSAFIRRYSALNINFKQKPVIKRIKKIEAEKSVQRGVKVVNRLHILKCI